MISDHIYSRADHTDTHTYKHTFKTIRIDNEICKRREKQEEFETNKTLTMAPWRQSIIQ